MKPVPIFCLLLSMANAAASQDKLSLFFANDSINGFQLSDAYETHNMGLAYERDGRKYALDLAIVSPDMHVYRNQFRVANRSYGEIISLRYEPNTINQNFQTGVNLKFSGKFNLDLMQALMHKTFNLAKVDEINDLVRMPDEVWVSADARWKVADLTVLDKKIDLWSSTYLGNDKTAASFEITPAWSKNRLAYRAKAGAEYIFHNDIVSSPPINANHRKFIPYINFGINYDLDEYSIYVEERVSLPTINSDNRLYAILSAGIQIPLK